ncbi:dynein regulatory complex subunit 2-like isoform X2 [Amphibalanus amphitrite]|nr:dynein regulatory complex subunit 2-like isoform X2 [Amphibalanus amphitrite]XP_043224446.1 dynein regulatory complex subunit 2-like isoform X2 [Amphibalanus amphitrite]XP_043224456.1 dynein regulatory complex subunit 2-like isoform X2 [Amphibalanus amphitrite]
MEEEQRRRRQELLSIFLKIKLTKEEEMTKTNTHKLNDRWRTIMRDLKAKELIGEIETLRQVFESQLDKRDEIIRRLFKEIEDGDEQHNIAVRTHIENLERIVDGHRLHLREARTTFDERLVTLNYRYEREMKGITELHTTDMDKLGDILYKIDTDMSEADKEARAEFQSKKEEVKNKNIEERQGLKLFLESVIEGLWDRFQKTLRTYYEETEGRRKAFYELKAREENSVEVIANQTKKIQNLQDEISKLRSRLVDGAQEHSRRTSSLKEDRNNMKLYLRRVKTDVATQRRQEDVRMKQLTVITGQVIKQLELRERDADQIMKLSECCRKLETEEQKIMPFREAPLTDREKRMLEASAQEPAQEPLAEALTEYSALENFWRRYNTALLDRTALALQKADLRSENQQLQEMLRDYLENLRAGTVTKAEGILPQMKASSLSVAPAASRRASTANVIEAAHVAKHLLPSCSRLPPCCR